MTDSGLAKRQPISAPNGFCAKVDKSVHRFSKVLLLACATLTGCASLQPSPMYRLDNGTFELSDQADGSSVLLAPVVLADYLQRDALLQRLPDGSLAEDGQHARWAGRLQDDVDQLLLRQLAWRLKTQSLELSPASKGFTPDVQVEVEITRLDSGPEHPAVLEAQWRLLDKKGRRLSSRLVRLQELHQGSTTDQVQAQSRLLQRLSELVASSIEPVLASQEQAKRNIVTAPPVKREVTEPAIPAAKPIRAEMEVFRF